MPSQSMKLIDLERVDAPTSFDIKCGTGNEEKQHVGNALFKHVVSHFVEDYTHAKSKKDKMHITKTVLNLLTHSGVRFLKKCPIYQYWYIAGPKVGRDKIGHFLRLQCLSMPNQATRNAKAASSCSSSLLRCRLREATHAISPVAISGAIPFPIEHSRGISMEKPSCYVGGFQDSNCIGAGTNSHMSVGSFSHTLCHEQDKASDKTVSFSSYSNTLPVIGSNISLVRAESVSSSPQINDMDDQLQRQPLFKENRLSSKKEAGFHDNLTSIHDPIAIFSSSTSSSSWSENSRCNHDAANEDLKNDMSVPDTIKEDPCNVYCSDLAFLLDW